MLDEKGEIFLNANKYDFVQDLAADKDIYARAILNDDACNFLISQDGLDTGDLYLGKGNETLGYSIVITERNRVLTMTRLNHEEQLEKSNSGDPYVG